MGLGRARSNSGRLGVRRVTEPGPIRRVRRFGWGETFAMKILLRFLGFLFAAGTILFIVGVTAVAGMLLIFSIDLPEYSHIKYY